MSSFIPSKGDDDIRSAKYTVQVSTSFTPLLIAMRTSTVAPASKFAFIVFKIKRSSHSVVLNKGRQTCRLTDWINGIAFTICTNQFHLPKKDRKGLKLGINEMEHEFLIRTFRSEKQDYLFRCSVAPGSFPLERTK